MRRREEYYTKNSRVNSMNKYSCSLYRIAVIQFISGIILHGIKRYIAYIQRYGEKARACNKCSPTIYRYIVCNVKCYGLNQKRIHL